MNAADEHGIIHPGTCPHPITGPTAGEKNTTSSNGNGTAKGNGEASGAAISAPGDDSSLQPKQMPSSVVQSDPTTPGGGDGGGGAAASDGQGTIAGAGGDSGPPAAGELVRPILLGVLQELCELARPEIAAAAVVAGVCKVNRWRVWAGGVG